MESLGTVLITICLPIIFWISFIVFKFYQSDTFIDLILIYLQFAKLSGKYSDVIVLRKDKNDLIQKMLKSNLARAKGIGMEYLGALPGWYPMLNSESVDGEIWKSMKRAVAHILPQVFNNNINLEDIIVKNFDKLLKENEMMFDHSVCTKLIISSYFELLFKDEISPSNLDSMYKFVEYMRACITGKVYNNIYYKQKWFIKGMNMIKNNEAISKLLAQVTIELKKNDLISNEFDENRIIYSAIFQPFIVSPAINFADIYGPMFYRIYNDSSSGTGIMNEIIHNIVDKNNVNYMDGLLFETLRLYHPFHIIERDMTQDFYVRNKLMIKKNTHIFIPIGNYFDDKKATNIEKKFDPKNWIDPQNEINIKYKWMTFLVGPRQCIGNKLAIQTNRIILKCLFNQYNQQDDILNYVKPFDGNVVSGRLNDDSFNDRLNVFILIRTFRFIFRALKYRWDQKKDV